MLEHLPRWVAALERLDKSPRTVDQYRHKVKQFEEWRGKRPIDIPALIAYRTYLQEERSLNPATIRVAFLALYQWFKWLEREGLIAEAPERGVVKMPKLLEPVRDVPSIAEMEALWDAARYRLPAKTMRQQFVRSRTLAVLACLDHCGIRRNELLGLHVSDIQELPDGWSLYIRRGKGGQSGRRPINQDALGVLREYLGVRQKWCYEHKHTTDSLFPVDKSRVLSELGLTTLWNALKAAAGLGHRGFGVHGVRHRFATDIYREHGSKAAQLLLGHSSAEVTNRHYLHEGEQLRGVVEGRHRGGGVRIPESRGDAGSQLPEVMEEKRGPKRALPSARRRRALGR